MECPFIDRCDKKHMEALGYLEMPNLASPYAESVVASTTEPILRETMAVMVDGSTTIDWDTLKKLAFTDEERRNSKNDDVREIVKILGGLGVQHPEYIASVLVNNGLGVKD